MQYVVDDLCVLMEELAPTGLALDWDNVGLQIGHPQKEVSTVLVTLTVTPDVVARSLDARVDLIIAHHPLIFRPIKEIRQDQPLGSLIATLVKHDIALYVSHTNLDQAQKGLNHWLAEELQLQETTILVHGSDAEVGLGRVGRVVPQTLAQLKDEVEQVLGHPIRVVGDLQRIVEKIAVLGGSGGGFIGEAKQAGVDVFITGDISYHQAVDALGLGLCLLDGGHFGTEQIMVAEVASYLRNHCPSLQVIEETSANPFQF